eukprot:g6881.t1
MDISSALSVGSRAQSDFEKEGNWQSVTITARVRAPPGSAVDADAEGEGVLGIISNALDDLQSGKAVQEEPLLAASSSSASSSSTTTAAVTPGPSDGSSSNGTSARKRRAKLKRPKVAKVQESPVPPILPGNAFDARMRTTDFKADAPARRPGSFKDVAPATIALPAGIGRVNGDSIGAQPETTYGTAMAEDLDDIDANLRPSSLCADGIECTRRAALQDSGPGDVCIPGTSICDLNLLWALLACGFLWVATTGDLVRVILWMRGADKSAAGQAGDTQNKDTSTAADKGKGEGKAEGKDGSDVGAAGKKDGPGTGKDAAKKPPAVPHSALGIVPLLAIAVVVALGVLAMMSSGALGGAVRGGGGIADVDAKMRARLEQQEAARMARATGGGGISGNAARDAATAEAQAARDHVKKAMAEERQKQKQKHQQKKKREPRKKVEYTFALRVGAPSDAAALERIKTYADEHSLLGHVYVRGGQVQGRFQGREDRVKAGKPWLEALDGVGAGGVEWEDALAHQFDKFEIMRGGH